MAAVKVTLGDIGSAWAKACKQAVADLNVLFKQNGIPVALATSGAEGPTITVKTDPGILGTMTHGQTTAETTGSGKLLRAEVRLPVKVVINTPGGLRAAGPGILEVIAAHEFVHALEHAPHNSHLMAQTMTKQMGDTPAKDRLAAGGVVMPPLLLAPESVEALKAIWG